ncbi:adenosine kinase [Nibricoccus sp. IMCC34717]|uniref:adenosine kinase n=1 Tax=Nibricoccus sp. IMCC34717 TaxID=3034021 RepID=UPI00384C4D6B
MSSPTFDLIGVGAPIMDIVASVPDSFLATVRGEKGGMVMVDAPEMEDMVKRLPNAPSFATGGSAANTTFNATRLGLRTAFVGKLGNDTIANAYVQRFAETGVNTSRFKHGTIPNGRCLILTTPDAQRTMRTYLGAVMTMTPEEISAADFAGARHVHIEGYVLFNRALADATVNAARQAGCTIGLSLASFEVVRAARDWILQQFEAGVAVVFANEDEAKALYPELAATTPEDYAAHAQRIAAGGRICAITLGKDGAWVAEGSTLHRIPPLAVADVIDTNGAGDAWAAGFLAAWLKGRNLPTAGRIGSLLGAETVRHAGAIIPDKSWPAVAEAAAKISA